ncbi:MAG: hypothetical protein WCY15_02415 [Phenylobacterium sp.]|uniref:hypothetical protein n=1 Tax=Phenylobacterium sp. TaxID=1871053 RepID=UPI002A369349|nr:hypothetical protein [Phenylobacterium sp.]MDX9996862.1 hypothetical protein [Phenylobacterium sp.]
MKRPEAHKRLMLLATISLLDAPIAKWFLTFADLLVVAAVAYDWRTRGRPHPVWIVGGVVLVLMQVSRPMIAVTPQWKAAAALLGRLGAP